MDLLRPLEHWDREFESHSRHECLFAFILCVGSDLATGCSPVQGVLPSMCRIKKLKKAAKVQQRAVEPQRERIRVLFNNGLL
jgi:hypothetical protein